MIQASRETYDDQGLVGGDYCYSGLRVVEDNSELYSSFSPDELAFELARFWSTREAGAGVTEEEDVATDLLLGYMQEEAELRKIDSDRQTEFLGEVIEYIEDLQRAYEVAIGEEPELASDRTDRARNIVFDIANKNYLENTTGHDTENNGNSGEDEALVADFSAESSSIIEEMEAEFIDRFNGAGVAGAEGRDDADKLFEEAQELGSKVFKAQISERLDKVHGAITSEDYDIVDILEDEMMSILDLYLRLNGVNSQSEEAKRLHKNLQNALDGGQQDIFEESPEKVSEEPKEDAGFIPEGSFDEDDVLSLTPKLSDKSRFKTTLRDKIQKFKNIFEDPDPFEKKVKIVSGVITVAAVVALAFITPKSIDKFRNDDEREVVRTDQQITDYEAPTTVAPGTDLEKSIDKEMQQHEELREAGVTDAMVRMRIIRNPRAFEHMANNPTQFASMLEWYHARTAQLIQSVPGLSSADAQAQAEGEFRVFTGEVDTPS